MTPQEQQASDVMHRQLGVKCAPVTTVHYPHNKLYLGGGLYVESVGAVLRLKDDDTGEAVLMTAAQIQAFEQFLISIGWRCS